MNYQITSDNIELSKSMVELAKEKASRLEPRFAHVKPESKSCRIVMNSAPQEMFTVKIELVVNGKKFFSDETSYTLENSLINSVEELDRMLSKEDKGSKWKRFFGRKEKHSTFETKEE